MLNGFVNIFRIPDLRNKVFFTLGMLVIYRIGFWVPLVGVDQAQVAEAARTASQDATGFGRIVQFASIFSGGFESVDDLRAGDHAVHHGVDHLPVA
jgi:preprotein translocase subunit SecY